MTLATRLSVGFLFPRDYGDTLNSTTAPNAHYLQTRPGPDREDPAVSVFDQEKLLLRAFYSGGPHFEPRLSAARLRRPSRPGRLLDSDRRRTAPSTATEKISEPARDVHSPHRCSFTLLGSLRSSCASRYQAPFNMVAFAGRGAT